MAAPIFFWKDETRTRIKPSRKHWWQLKILSTKSQQLLVIILVLSSPSLIENLIENLKKNGWKNASELGEYSPVHGGKFTSAWWTVSPASTIICVPSAPSRPSLQWHTCTEQTTCSIKHKEAPPIFQLFPSYVRYFDSKNMRQPDLLGAQGESRLGQEFWHKFIAIKWLTWSYM